MTLDSCQMLVHMFQWMACRCARRWITADGSAKGQGPGPDHKALSVELDKGDRQMAWWSKWLGCSPRL